MGGLLVSLLIAMRIQASGSCPSGAEVERHLAPLLPPGFESNPLDAATVEEDPDGGLILSLSRIEQGTLIRRRLPRAPTCAQQAEVVAVTLAAWESQAHADLAPRIDDLLLYLHPHLSQATTTQLTSNQDQPPSPGNERARGGLALRALGAGFAGAWEPGSFAPAGRVDTMLGAGESPWRARLSLVGLGQHALDLPPGQARWWRLYLALGADYSIPVGARWAVTAGAAAVWGVVSVAGSGYAIDHHAWNVDIGGEVLTRLEWRQGRMRPWLGLALVTWLRRQNLEVAAAATSPSLPRAEPMAVLGADFAWGR